MEKSHAVIRESSIEFYYIFNIQIYSHEWFLAIFREHGNEYIKDNLGFGQICCCAFNEHILCTQVDFGVLTYDEIL
jgi:hypothetical protein